MSAQDHIDAANQGGMVGGPKRYRKKPVVIEAMQFTGDNIDAIWEWVGAGSVYGPTEESASARVETTEGPMEMAPGWWLIRGVEGELYPCKPSVFDATYDLA